MQLHSQDLSTGRFYPQLDGLRAIAILLVVIHHCIYIPPLGDSFGGISIPQSGRLGVAVFFVLSGFLMGMTVFRKDRPFNTPAYSLRRAGKIYPPFLLSIAFATLIYLAANDACGVARQIVLYVTSLGSFVPIQAPINNVYWSLLVEIQFYVALPLVHACFKSFTTRPGWWTSATFLVLPILYRMYVYLTQGNSGEYADFFSQLHKRADAFALGLFFACHVMGGASAFTRRHADALSAGGLVLMVVTLAGYEASFYHPKITGDFMRTLALDVAYLLVQLATVGMMCSIFSETSRLSRALSGRSMALIGLVSYEWYLFHMPMLDGVKIVGESLRLPPAIVYLLKLGVPTVGGFLVAWAVYHWFSLPILESLKRRMKTRANANPDRS